jgi:phosphoadenosine phosphosulfate reductase
LAIESRCDVIFSHSHTTVDAPETVYFVRSEMERLKTLGYKTQILYPKKSMWQLIEGKRGMPPTRLMRYCCAYFKERNVSDDKKAFIVTGVRWAESANRKNSREEFEVRAAKKADAIKVKANDNDLDRKLFEECKLKGERICNPILEWTEEDVWNYLNARNVKTNPLYKLGFKRIGCIGCPMASKQQKVEQFERWPKYKKAYIDAIDRGIKKGLSDGKEYTWAGGVERFEFWING